MYTYTSLNPVSSYNYLETPIIIYLKITNSCCFHCGFCSAGEAKFEHMDFSFITRIFSAFKNYGVERIFYTGGEPLMHPDIIKILQLGRETGFQQALLTNGFLLTENNINQVLKNIDSIGISLHGNPSLHDNLVGVQGASSKVLSVLDMIHKKYPLINIGINCTLTEQNSNFDEIKYLAEIAKQYNGILNVSRLNYAGKAKTNFKIKAINNVAQIIQKLKMNNFKVDFGNCVSPCLLDSNFSHLGHGCSAGITTACIDINGDLKICPSASVSLGNLKEKSLRDLWNTRQMVNFRSFSWIPPQCSSCNFFQKCKSGCRVEVKNSFSKKIGDTLVCDKFAQVWDKMRSKKYVFSGDFIRKDFNLYTIIAPHIIRLCNKNTLLLIKKLTGEKTCEEIIKTEKNSEECKNLLIALKIDMLLKEK